MTNKLVLTLKAPDALDYGIKDYLVDNPDADEDNIRDIASNFFKWGEYCTIEIDLINRTAKVLTK
jgi:hypothetical protein